MQCSSASRCEEAKAPLLLIRSHRLAHIVLHSSFHRDRAMLTNALIDALGLLAKLHVQESSPAPLQALLEYHTPEYLHALAASRTLHLQKLARFGLEDDCAPFPALLEYSCLCAGGSLQAAAALNARTHQFAVHFDGGRHHARKARAAGFCWINDVILAILHLLRAHKRVLYIDLDVHHGDAVEEAFATSDRVLTLSLHRFAPGYFPGSGALGAGGSGAGSGFALNLPLGEGLRDDVFVDAVTTLTHGAIEVFDPEVVVAQCGCDGLAGDPVGRSWALTPVGFHGVGSLLSGLNLPVLVLGGGGYAPVPTACSWAALLAGILRQTMPEDVPDHEHLERYGPSFSVRRPGRTSLLSDSNDAATVRAAIGSLLGELEVAVARRSGRERHAELKRARVL